MRAVLFLSIVALAALGMPIARKFLRGLFLGADLYVVREIDGHQVVYKNPGKIGTIDDQPMETAPTEIFTSDQYETYFNICWFDGNGALQRCGHSYHRTAENASFCKLAGTEDSFIGKILEQR
jgi:hypothetical protein